MMPLSSYLGFPGCEKYQAAKKLEKRRSKEWRVFQLSVTSRWNEVETTKLVFQTCFARVVVSCHVYQLLLFHLSNMRFWLGWARILYFFQPTSEVKNICDSHLLQYWTKRDTFITVENWHLDQPIRVFFLIRKCGFFDWNCSNSSFLLLKGLKELFKTSTVWWNSESMDMNSLQTRLKNVYFAVQSTLVAQDSLAIFQCII